MHENLSEGPGDNLGDVLDANPSKPEPDTESEIVSMRKMMEEQRKMLNNAVQLNTHLCVQNANVMEPN